MLNHDLKEIKRHFYELVGELSIEEIMTNQPLMEQIKQLTSLLLRYMDQLESETSC